MTLAEALKGFSQTTYHSEFFPACKQVQLGVNTNTTIFKTINTYLLTNSVPRSLMPPLLVGCVWE